MYILELCCKSYLSVLSSGKLVGLAADIYLCNEHLPEKRHCIDKQERLKEAYIFTELILNCHWDNIQSFMISHCFWKSILLTASA